VSLLHPNNASDVKFERFCSGEVSTRLKHPYNASDVRLVRVVSEDMSTGPIYFATKTFRTSGIHIYNQCWNAHTLSNRYNVRIIAIIRMGYRAPSRIYP
jgi:hypothetical protein